MNDTATGKMNGTVRKRGGSPRAGIRRVTPKEAETLLKNRDGQRPLSKGTVLRYDSIMQDGEWQLSPDCITIDWNGNVINGQHRLSAVVASGQSQEFVLLEGVDPSTFQVTDGGKRRTAADTLSVLGYPNATFLGFIARCLANYIDAECRLKTTTTRLSQENYRIAEIAGAHPGLREAASFARSVADGLSGLCSPSMFGLLHFLASEGGHQGAFERYATSVATGLNLLPDTGAHRLRDRLLTTALSKESLPDSEILAITVKGFRSDVAGKRVRQLRWRNAGDRAESFPQMPDTPQF